MNTQNWGKLIDGYGFFHHFFWFSLFSLPLCNFFWLFPFKPPTLVPREGGYKVIESNINCTEFGHKKPDVDLNNEATHLVDVLLHVDDDLVEGITVAALAVLDVGDIAAILRAEAYLDVR